MPALQCTPVKRLVLAPAALLIAGCAGGAQTGTASTVNGTRIDTAQPTIAQTAGDPTPPPTTAPKTVVDSRGGFEPAIDNDGTYLVGADIIPGKYRNTGGTMCSWARLRDLDPSDIIASDKTAAQEVIEIQVSDIAFLTHNCGVWQMISPFA